MSRRRYIPLSVRVQVAERQFKEATGCECTDEYGVPLRLSGASSSARLKAALWHLAGVGKNKLELHHRPALVNRPMNRRKTDTVPPANDPDHLVYLLKDEEHRVETYVRGVGAQRSDVSQRRYLKKVAKNRQSKTRRNNSGNKKRQFWPSRKLVTGMQLRGRLAKLTASRPIAARKTPWPKGRKMEWKR